MTLQFTLVDPVPVEFFVAFNVEKQGGIVDLIIHSQLLYIQPGKPKNRLSNTINFPRLMVEIPSTHFSNEAFIRSLINGYVPKELRQSQCRKVGLIMATTAIWDVTGRLDRVIDYATNPQKTENLDFSSPGFQGLQNVLAYTQQDSKTEKQFYVTGINCDPATACRQMNRAKLQFQKTGSILAFHGYQAFAPGEATPETTHTIGVKPAQELWGDRFEVVVSTHLDKEHLHNHFVLNSVSFMDGKRYYDNNTTYALMRKTFDRLCREHSLSVIENPKRGKARHYAEWKAEQENKPTWRSLIREDVDKAVATSMTLTQFIAALRNQR
jgi:hypothetical protein